MPQVQAQLLRVGLREHTATTASGGYSREQTELNFHLGEGYNALFTDGAEPEALLRTDMTANIDLMRGRRM